MHIYKYTIAFFLFLISLINVQHAAAQNKLFLCNQYQIDGSYSGVFENWTIQKEGNFMYLFYESTTPIEDTLYVMIDKVFDRKDTNYYEYDHYYLVPGMSKKWAANKYVFTKTGKYKITVYDRHDKQLAAPYITTLSFEDTTYKEMYTRDTWYYSTSNIAFYEKSNGDTLFGKRSTFEYKPEGNKVFLYIGQNEKRPFKTNHLIAKIYTADKCHEFLNTNTFYVKDDWHWTFVTLHFNQKGKYDIELYNDDDVFINSAALEIK